MNQTNEPSQSREPLTWDMLRESFGPSLAVPRAVCLRGGLSDLHLLTLARGNQHGYAFQGERRMEFGHDPDVTLRVSPRMWGTATGLSDGRLTTDTPLFPDNRFGPDIIERSGEYPAAGLSVRETCLRTPDADYLWNSEWERNVYRAHAPQREEGDTVPFQMHLVLELREQAELSWQALPGGLILSISPWLKGGTGLHLAIKSEGAACIGIVNGNETCLRRIRIPSCTADPMPCLIAAGAAELPAQTPTVTDAAIIFVRWEFPRRATRRLTVAWSTNSAERAGGLLQPSAETEARQAVAAEWNEFLAGQTFPAPPAAARSLEEQLAGKASRQAPGHYLDSDGRLCPQEAHKPVAGPESLTDADFLRAYGKCLALTRLCERNDPRWGATLTETFTCFYSGTFAWSAPVVGWYARRQTNPPTRDMMRAVFDCYRRSQGLDGSLPCYVAFNTAPPAEPPATHSHTQIPQYAWGVWQEFLHNGDEAWLEAWYEPLRRYAEYMDTLDRKHLNLGLWCQTHYYDGIDMFPTVDGLVIRKEPVLYSAVFAAEQVRYLEVMAHIARRVNPAEAAGWQAARDAALRILHEKLWDQDRQWFGDILADGRRETVVGVVGLFAAAYGLLPANHDPRAVRENLESLITPFGVATVAPSDRRYTERFFWRGPVWPASCLYGAGAARRYAPDLLPRIAAATVRHALAQPNIFECLEPHSGHLASYDEGANVMPGVSSVVGSFAICATLDLCAGVDLFSLSPETLARP